MRREIRAITIVTPAEGPSLGMAPEGMWIWISVWPKKSGSIPRAAV
jgi:hypothetical protein